MPKRTDIHKVMIIGSGPIIIGQACEFDYSGTQACKALRSLGYEIVLVNSNPATIMTDPGTADRTYIEPLNVERLTAIIEKERPDAILPNLGGQSALNLSSELSKTGVLEKYGVKVIGVQVDAIERGEDREAFKELMSDLGIEMARSKVAYSVEEAVGIARELGYPCVLRPAYTMGGTGGGLVYNVEELRRVVARGLAASPVHEVLVEESVLGWEELEFEVVRDANGKMITVCTIENIDPMGIHTGDSFCVAPMQTIAQETIDRLQEKSYRIVDAVKVIGGTNVQWAHDPVSDRDIIIEINPRTSRSSALASKATGFPIALISAMLASGLTLDEIPCGKWGTLDQYHPDGDYVVVKFARWAFEKFKSIEDRLGTQMRAVGEVMSIGKTYKEAFQKAIRSLEQGRYGLGFAKDFHEKTLGELIDLLAYPTSERQFVMYEALRKGCTVDQLFVLTHIKVEFLQEMAELVAEEQSIIAWSSAHPGKLLPPDMLRLAKQDGFADRYLAQICTGLTEADIRAQRAELGIHEGWYGVHVSSTPDSAYYYSTYNAPDASEPLEGDKIMILGGGPNRIGQGIEFDYCSVHAAKALRGLGFKTIIVNCNPETVSTDYDTSDKLYFEPLTAEDVLSIYEKEKPLGMIIQFGGQTPLNLASELKAAGCRILGTTPEVIDLAEDRDEFRAMMDKLGIPMPESAMAVTVDEALDAAHEIGYPVMVRPSYVLGGRGMEVVFDDNHMRAYMAAAIGVTPDRPILIDRYLQHALECEADAICDGYHAYVPAVMEHVELAGVHSGDSACVLPSVTISDENLALIKDYTRRIAQELHVVGLMNIQYAIENGKVYCIEANPRASRTVPLVSKVCGINMVQIATGAITGELTGLPSPVAQLKEARYAFYGVKEAVLPFSMFPEVDPILGPEMRSTGEVLGLAPTFGEAFVKSQEATGMPLANAGNVLMSIADRNKDELAEVAQMYVDAGFQIIATRGTAAFLAEHGIPSTVIFKQREGRPNITDAIKNGQIDLIVNTPQGDGASNTDGSYIRKEAIRAHIPFMTTMAAARAAALGVATMRSIDGSGVNALQDIHAMIK